MARLVIRSELNKLKLVEYIPQGATPAGAPSSAVVYATQDALLADASQPNGTIGYAADNGSFWFRSMGSWVSYIRDWARVVFAPTPGQINFTLPSVATDPDTYSLTVNGIEYVRGTDFTVSGTSLTWLNTFLLALGDRVMVAYEV